MQPQRIIDNAQRQLVSILTRPEGRMQLSKLFSKVWASAGFNPHPARRPDATWGGQQSMLVTSCFNPHPARRPDATCITKHNSPYICCFNPHPARRPDATAAC